MVSESALVLLYVCVLAIKACNVSTEVCTLFGFGESPNGIFLFFLFFALTVLLVQMSAYAVILLHGFARANAVKRIRLRDGEPLVLSFVRGHDYHLFLSRAPPLHRRIFAPAVHSDDNLRLLTRHPHMLPPPQTS
eukprot:7389237-Prymnesium_polylepis.2